MENDFAIPMHFTTMIMKMIIISKCTGTGTSRILNKTGENEHLYLVSGRTFQYFTILHNMNSH